VNHNIIMLIKMNNYILPFASNRDRQTLKRVCLRLKRHVGRVKHANYNVETKRFDRDM
jgi:hypothetical protein